TIGTPRKSIIVIGIPRLAHSAIALLLSEIPREGRQTVLSRERGISLTFSLSLERQSNAPETLIRPPGNSVTYRCNPNKPPLFVKIKQIRDLLPQSQKAMYINQI